MGSRAGLRHAGQDECAGPDDTGRDPDADTQKGQVCEADFYIGESRLSADKAEAAHRFHAAQQECPSNYIELQAARAELSLPEKH